MFKPIVSNHPVSETYRRLTEDANALEWFGDWVLHNHESTTTRWPRLQPPQVESLPEFPIQALPEMVRSWVREVSRMTQTPLDLAAMLALTAGSAAAGNRCRITAREGWSEPTSLFAAVMMESGSRQSAVFTEAMRPLREWETQRRSSGAVSPPLGEDSAAGRRRYAESKEPAVISRFLGESTDRLLLASLVEHGGTATLSASGGILRQIAGRTNLSLREQVRIFEAAYEGEPLVFQRTPTRFLQIERPALACGLAIDPSVLDGVAKSPRFAGNSLINRFLFAMPDARLGRRQIAPPPISKFALGGYRAAMRNLLTVASDSELSLSPEAEQLLRDWETEIEPQLADRGRLAGLRQWKARLPGATLRIAAILHLMDNVADMPVSGAIMSGAIAIGRYLIPHAVAAFERMGAIAPLPEADFDYMLRWIERHGLRSVSVRGAHQEVRDRFESPSEVQRALEGLARRGYVRKVKVKVDTDTEPKNGRPPSDVFEVNPAVFEPDAEEGPEAGEELRLSSAYPWRDYFFPAPIFGDLASELDPQKAELIQRVKEQEESDQFKALMLRTYREYAAVARSVRRKREQLAKKSGVPIHKTPQTLEKTRGTVTRAAG